TTLTATTRAIKCCDWSQPTWRASPGADRLTVAGARNSTFSSPGKRPLKFCLILKSCGERSRRRSFVCEGLIDARSPVDPIDGINEVVLAREKPMPFGV